MILVDDAGGVFPSINHSPWFGVTIADFVMPCFLFGIGVSITFVFKRIPNKKAATEKVIIRTIKLFLLGLVLQGEYFHGRNHLTYGVDIDRIRWLGVLQQGRRWQFLLYCAGCWLSYFVLCKLYNGMILYFGCISYTMGHTYQCKTFLPEGALLSR